MMRNAFSMPRRLALLGLICAVAAGGSAARAATFDVISSGKDEVLVINPAAVEAVANSTIRRVTSVSVKRSLMSGGPPQPGYISTLNEYDCAAWTTRWRNFTAYSRTGEKVLHKDNDDQAWTPIGASIEARVAARVVCDHQDVGAVYAAPSVGQLVLALMQSWDAEAPPPAVQPAEPVAPVKAPPKPKAKSHPKSPSRSPGTT